MKTYSGKYTPINPEKYVGDVKDIVYRSGWERNTFKWMDLNPDVVSWSSETVVVPYIGPDEKIHRYYIDICVKYTSGKVFLIEIKPKHQTEPPKPSRGKKTSTLVEEARVFMVNEAKWKAADMYAKKNGATFQVWTEKVLNAIGIPTN